MISLIVLLVSWIIPCFLAVDFGFQSSGKLEDPALFYSFQVKTIEGNTITFESMKGKVIMFTNVASECGYTSQNYKQLSQLKEEFHDKIEIVLLPSNDFGEQEPGNSKEIRKFINTHGGESYVVLEKAKMNGPDQHPLIEFFKKVTKSERRTIDWNFETKFVVSPGGKTIARYSEAYEPLRLRQTIIYYLKSAKTDL